MHNYILYVWHQDIKQFAPPTDLGDGCTLLEGNEQHGHWDLISLPAGALLGNYYEKVRMFKQFMRKSRE